MELQYHGANCIRITTKKSHLLVDPVSDLVELKVDIKKAHIILATQKSSETKVSEEQFLINSPGEYEFQEASIKGVAAQAHIAASGDKSSTMYRITIADTAVLIVGHIAEKLSEAKLEEIGIVDVVVVPVGGGGYTLDAVGAATVVRALEPKLVIPVHYQDRGLNYSIPQQELDLFTKELGAVTEEPIERLKLKAVPEQLTVQPLLKS